MEDILIGLEAPWSLWTLGGKNLGSLGALGGGGGEINYLWQ